LEDVGTGCGWAITHGDQIIEEESIPLGKNATVFQAELIAIQAVLIWLKINLATVRQKTRVERLQIWSDSQSAIAAIYSRLIQVNWCSKLKN
jgi:ribonuclease HI